jgi:ribosomal protein S18 acetylase RimI-like enzyme
MARETIENHPPAAVLPAELREEGFALRPETDGDAPFLQALYASTRAAELANAPWSDEQKQAFCLSQFEAQRRHYRAHFENCVFSVLERAGEPVGRLYLERRGAALHIVDIALAPAWRGKGIGGRVLTGAIDFAAAARLGVSIHVEKFNPALRLYERVGFAPVEDLGVYLRMLRAAPPPDECAAFS